MIGSKHWGRVMKRRVRGRSSRMGLSRTRFRKMRIR